MTPMLYRLERATTIGILLLCFRDEFRFVIESKLAEAKRQRAGRTAEVLAGGSSRFHSADVTVTKTRADAKIMCHV